MEGIIKMVKSLEESDTLWKCVTKTIEEKQRKEVDFVLCYLVL